MPLQRGGFLLGQGNGLDGTLFSLRMKHDALPRRPYKDRRLCKGFSALCARGNQLLEMAKALADGLFDAIDRLRGVVLGLPLFWQQAKSAFCFVVMQRRLFLPFRCPTSRKKQLPFTQLPFFIGAGQR